jgi:hypothetical protein
VNVKTKAYALQVESLQTLFGTLERRYTLFACKAFKQKVSDKEKVSDAPAPAKPDLIATLAIAHHHTSASSSISPHSSAVK